METIYTNVWADQDCLSAAMVILAIATAAILAPIALVGGVAYWALRRRGSEPRARLAVWSILGVIAVGLLGLAVFIVFFDGRTYRRIAFGQGAFVFEGCQGATAVSERVAVGDIAAMAYRSRWTGGRSGRLVHEVFLATTGRRSFAIPLSLSDGTSNHEALARILPRRVIDDYAAALRERGSEPPAAYQAGR